MVITSLYPSCPLWAADPGWIDRALIGGVSIAGVDTTLPTTGYSIERGVAIIPVHGPITKARTAWTVAAGGTALADFTVALEQAITDPGVHSIIIDFDSPGGTIFGLDDPCHLIRRAGEAKPVIAFVQKQLMGVGLRLAVECARVVMGPLAQLGWPAPVQIVLGLAGPPSVDTWATYSPDAYTDALGHLDTSLIAQIDERRAPSPPGKWTLEDHGCFSSEGAEATGLADYIVTSRDVLIDRVARGEWWRSDNANQ